MNIHTPIECCKMDKRNKSFQKQNLSLLHGRLYNIIYCFIKVSAVTVLGWINLVVSHGLTIALQAKVCGLP